LNSLFPALFNKRLPVGVYRLDADLRFSRGTLEKEGAKHKRCVAWKFGNYKELMMPFGTRKVQRLYA
jgi:hypothetical protein